MPKSRVRKNHKKKVEQRNNRIKNEFERAQKEAWKKFEEHKLQQSTSNVEEEFKYPEFK